MRSNQLLVLPCALLLSASTMANNIQVANASLTNNTGTSVMVQFDLNWENSWRGGGVNNWDAAWVFVKYKLPSGVWQHVLLNNTGHVAPTGSQIDIGLVTPSSAYNATTNPVVGAFIYRNAAGNGNVAFNAVQLRWDYGALGLAYNDISAVEVFAIEMVYVAPGAFAAGTGESDAFTLTTINTAMPTTAPSGTGALGGQAGGYPTGQTAPIATWPNGFSAFYCMKYELTQQAYVDFLNTLTYTQQVARTATAPSSVAGTSALYSVNANRNGIDIQTPGVASTVPALYACNLNANAVYGEAADGKDIACNYLGWYDLAAYMDWSGFRPMTEMEFEKACRGPLMPVQNEFAWGTPSINNAVYTLSAVGTSAEGIATNYSTTEGNSISINAGGSLGPVRVGIFAANPGNTGRVSSGATYYGIMDMSGNLQERVIGIGTVAGRAFAGTHGNGSITVAGEGDVATWPTSTGASGSGFHGGCWEFAIPLEWVSLRTSADFSVSTRAESYGGRGVRSAP